MNNVAKSASLVLHGKLPTNTAYPPLLSILLRSRRTCTARPLKSELLSVSMAAAASSEVEYSTSLSKEAVVTSRTN